jgi:ectoine hydroxylase-related dioxygenase (phytanoyl-CoA dioxygenase family)
MTWLAADTCEIDEFIALVEQSADLTRYPHAAAIERGTVVYDSSSLREATASPGGRRAVMSELADVLLDGPGIVVFRGAFEQPVVNAASAAFFELIEKEKANAIGGGDHFAKPGANDRVWNALEKLALHDPQVFVDYYSNDLVDLISTAWLGPAYQVTSQVNVVNPGGEAQEPHRDYHLGFMTSEEAASFPAHVHRLSPMMTLQGAVAHCDMPLETGPTMYLPHSQKYEAGYLAWRRDDFKAYFAEHHVQLTLQLGDAVFFNPALFHGAGTNVTSDVYRIANLLQVGTAMGRTLEAVDRGAMLDALYPVFLDRVQGGADRALVDCAVAAAAEGYPFPCNLDVDKPIGSLTPPSDADRVRSALNAGTSGSDFSAVLAARRL